MKLLLLISILLHTFLFANTHVDTSFSYIEISEQDENITDIIMKSKQGLFSSLDKDHSKFGFTDNIFWIRAHVKNKTSSQIEQILELNYPVLDYIDIYILKDENLILKKELGDLRIYDKNTFMPNPHYDFLLSPFEEKTFFIRIKSTGSLNIGTTIQDVKTYNLSSSIQIKWLSFYFGAVLIMLMYNFIIFLIIKNRSFLYYVLFHLSYLAFALGLSGIAFELFWPQIPDINRYILPISMPLTGAFGLLFTIHFLDIKNISIKLTQFLYFFAIISFLVSVSVFFIGYSLAIQIGSLITFISVLFLFILSFYLVFFKRNINSLFYLIAWSFFLTGVAVSHLSNIGIIPSTILTNFSSQIGSFFEVLLLSIGLAYYYNRLRKEHLELSYSNNLLRDLSHTDVLTKSYNRRYFYEHVRQCLNKTNQSNNEIALLMLDLDHFKKINDNYGHDIGDQVLMSFVTICKKIIRKDDVFARYGGEEFVLYLPNTDKKTAFDLAQKINTTLSKYIFVASPGLSITVSIGISTNIFDLEALLKQADIALYKAKYSGRNTIIMSDH